MKTKWLLLFVLLASVLLLAGCGETLEWKVPVMVAETDGISVSGENPVWVNPGETVSFSVALEDGVFYLDNDAGASYENGTLTLSRVLYPTTVTLETVRNPSYYGFDLQDPRCQGKMSTTQAPAESVLGGTEITVSAEPLEGNVFSSWTVGASATRGGTVVSKEATYTFTLASDTVLYPNYISAAEAEAAAAAKMQLLVYNANGGKVKETGETLYYQDVDVSYFKLPNCLAEKGYFEREGYILIEYNTKADGTGDAYSLGSKIITPTYTGDAVMLYCIWAKESDASLFETKESGGKLTVTKYTGNEDTVVIPKAIGGKPVTKIAANAFQKKKFTTIVFPESIREVEKKSFVGCPNFTTLYMFDTVEKIWDDSFADLTNFQHFYLNAAMTPKYAGSTEGNFCIKWERLVTTQDQNRIVIMSGSSSLYGLATMQLQEAFKNEYIIVNYGTNAGTAATFYMEICAPFMHEGDIMLQAPCPSSGTQLGSNEITWRLFRGTEQYYNGFRMVDMRHYNKLFTAFREFNEGRINMGDKAYGMKDGGMNEYGDISTIYPLNDPKYGWSKNSMLNPKQINDTWAKNLTRVHEIVQASGANVYMSYGPSNRNQYHDKGLTDEYLDKVDAGYQAAVTVPFISKVKDYIFEGQYMSNSNAHLGDEGRRIRTERLYNDLVVQMKKDGLYVP
ncbi:MAG: leucine-rich repeat protein [Clostridia bacterium]|nr:leucine-rich repeat protein [Clostridia bacterium]